MTDHVRRPKAARGAIAGIAGATLLIGSSGSAVAAAVAATEDVGAPAPAGYSAAVDKDGTLLRGAHAVSSERTGVGTYVVTFDTSVRECAVVATVTDTGTAGGAVQTASMEGGGSSVAVQTGGPTVDRADQGFTLEARCSAEKGAYGVISADGALVRGEEIRKVTRVGEGRYRVALRRPVLRCATTAAVGSPDSTALPTSGLISAVADDRRVVLVSTTDREGAFDDRPFHLIATCGHAGNRPWARLGLSGSVHFGNRVVDTQEVVPGVLEVTFDTSGESEHCTYTATPALYPSEFQSEPGTVRVLFERQLRDRLIVTVATTGTHGAQSPMNTSVSLIC